MSGPLRIAILTHSTNPRGGVSHALSVAEALTDLGHAAVVHAPDPSGRGFFRTARCGTVSVPAGPLAAPGTAAMVEQRIAEYGEHFGRPANRGFDIYHAHDGIGGNVLADLAARRDIPGFVRTVHHLDAFAEPGLAARQHRGVAAATRVLCVSEVWRSHLAHEFGIDAARVGNGVDTAEFSPVPDAHDGGVRARWGIGSGPVFLSVGGFEARKNSLGIIKAFAGVHAAMPGARLVVVGGASVLDHSAYVQRCNDLLHSLGLPDGPGRPVIRTGPVAQADMAAVYRTADTLVFASLNEGFGLAVIEAMACGTPAIVSSIPPFTDYLQPGDALWADPADPATIADAMRRSLDPTVRDAIIHRGLKLASGYTWRSSALVHLDVYGRLNHPSGHRRPEPVHA